MDRPKPDHSGKTIETQRAFADHRRDWLDFDFVYPVISRRSGGMSIGVNLSPDMKCDFNCVYCQVDRSRKPSRSDVDLDQVRRELDRMLKAVADGDVWKHDRFDGIESAYRRLNDIAFSGNGEPTLYKRFEEAVRIAADLRDKHALGDLKLIVITNASALHQKHVQQGLDILDSERDQVWAKLDAGTEQYYRSINRSKVPFEQILDNILDCGRRRPVVIQSLFASVHGEPVPDSEFSAYVDRLATLIDRGCRIQEVQLCTLAREPAEPYVLPLEAKHLEHLARTLQLRLNNVTVRVFAGPD